MCKNGGRPKFFWEGKKTKGNFSFKFLIFLTHMLSPTLNYSLTKSSPCGKMGCKRSMAQLSQDLLSTHCKMKKTASASQKKARKLPLWGLLFWKRNGNRQTKTGEWGEPLPRMAIPKGDGHRWKRWAVPKPKTSKESGFLFLARKSGIFHALLRRTYLKNRCKIGFSVAFPFWKKEEKEKKRIGVSL